MGRLQFRVLYREFLFRVIDLELLAPQGDVSKLLGQFAALLVIVSLWVMLPSTLVVGGLPPSEMALLATWAAEHFLIATTMLVVGLFAVLSWESMFPDRRDVLVLSPLPVRARTLFLAKVAAVATALSVTVLALNMFPGMAAPFAFPTAQMAAPVKYDAAMAPVRVEDLQAVLDHDLAPAREPGGGLVLGPEAGIAIGVVEHEVRRVFTYGKAQPDSLFEIGSISKTFTGLMLARMAAEGRVRLDEPVRELLPPGLVAKPAGDEITLLDLATQHSGLPRMPDNFKPADLRNPYADYHAANLYAYMAKRGVGRPAHPQFYYSNLGLGLLGQALANRAGTTYPKLLEELVTGPLEMHDTVVMLSPEQRARFIQGHGGDGKHEAVHAWDLDGLAGAGAIRSTAEDMLAYLEVQLHPERFEGFTAALETSHELRADVSRATRIALAWMYDTPTGAYAHGGATAGYSTYAFFHPKGDYATVVLFNTGPNIALDPDQMGEHIRQRLAGQPAVRLTRSVVAGKGGLLGGLRSFAAYWGTLFAAGVFLFGFVLTVQGAAQLLPRQVFLRLSSFLQLSCFCLFLTVYFMQVPFAGVDALMEGQRLLPWLPSYWYLALFQQLNGALPKVLEPLAKRAWMGLGLAVCGAGLAYAVCYFRTLRMIAEQPDILPGARGFGWLPRFGNSLETAVGQFALRTLFRSRQHRVILSFYLGISLGLAIFMSNAPVLRIQTGNDAWYQVNAPLAVASILMMCGAVMGARVVFAMPLALRANWIFRVVPPEGVPGCLAASRRALYGLAVVPVWAAAAGLFFWIWPWRAAAGHLVVLGLLGTTLAEVCLHGFQKIPFTCSYLPGKSRFHMAMVALFGWIFLITKAAAWERKVLDDRWWYAVMVAVLAAAAVGARWRTARQAKREESAIEFEDEADPVIMTLGL